MIRARKWEEGVRTAHRQVVISHRMNTERANIGMSFDERIECVCVMSVGPRWRKEPFSFDSISVVTQMRTYIY